MTDIYARSSMAQWIGVCGLRLALLAPGKGMTKTYVWGVPHDQLRRPARGVLRLLQRLLRIS